MKSVHLTQISYVYIDYGSSTQEQLSPFALLALAQLIFHEHACICTYTCGPEQKGILRTAIIIACWLSSVQSSTIYSGIHVSLHVHICR